jgi:hypothetical protein
MDPRAGNHCTQARYFAGLAVLGGTTLTGRQEELAREVLEVVLLTGLPPYNIEAAADGCISRPRGGSVAGLREGVRHAAQLLGGEVQGFYVRAGCLQGPQCCHVDRLPGSGLRLLVVVLGVGGHEGRCQRGLARLRP